MSRKEFIKKYNELLDRFCLKPQVYSTPSTRVLPDAGAAAIGERLWEILCSLRASDTEKLALLMLKHARVESYQRRAEAILNEL